MTLFKHKTTLYVSGRSPFFRMGCAPKHMKTLGCVPKQGAVPSGEAISIATGHGMQIYNCLNCPRQ